MSSAGEPSPIARGVVVVGSLVVPELLGQRGQGSPIAACQKKRSRRDRLAPRTFKVNMRLREPLGNFNGVGVSPMWGDHLQSSDQRVTGVVELEQWYAPTLADLDAVQAVRDQTLADATFVHTQPLSQLRHTQARSQDGGILGGRPGQRG